MLAVIEVAALVEVFCEVTDGVDCTAPVISKRATHIPVAFAVDTLTKKGPAPDGREEFGR